MFGVYVEANAGTTTAAVNDSVLSSNSDAGLFADANVTGATARWTAMRTPASHNGIGFSCQSGAGNALCTAGTITSLPGT